MDWYEPEVRALEGIRTTRRWPERPVVFYGSSSIKLWTTLPQDLSNPCIVNLGFGGSTLEACVRFFDRLVRPVRPSSLIVYAGDNDLGDGRTPRQVASWFGELLEKVHRDLHGIPFGFVSIKPSPARAPLLAQITETNATIQRTIAGYPWAFYVNVFTPMLGAKGQPRPELFLEDGLHLSLAGYRLWTQTLWPYRDRMFTKDCSSGHTTVLSSKLDGPRVP